MNVTPITYNVKNKAEQLFEFYCDHAYWDDEDEDYVLSDEDFVAFTDIFREVPDYYGDDVFSTFQEMVGENGELGEYLDMLSEDTESGV